jgi:hypothetical protein
LRQSPQLHKHKLKMAWIQAIARFMPFLCFPLNFMLFPVVHRLPFDLCTKQRPVYKGAGSSPNCPTAGASCMTTAGVHDNALLAEDDGAVAPRQPCRGGLQSGRSDSQTPLPGGLAQSRHRGLVVGED